MRKIFIGLLLISILFIPSNRKYQYESSDDVISTSIKAPKSKKDDIVIDKEKAKKFLSFLFLYHHRIIPEVRMKK